MCKNAQVTVKIIFLYFVGTVWCNKTLYVARRWINDYENYTHLTHARQFKIVWAVNVSDMRTPISWQEVKNVDKFQKTMKFNSMPFAKASLKFDRNGLLLCWFRNPTSAICMFVHAPIYLFVNLRTPVSLRVYSSLMFHTRHVRILFGLLGCSSSSFNSNPSKSPYHSTTCPNEMLKRKITEYRSCRYASYLKKR